MSGSTTDFSGDEDLETLYVLGSSNLNLVLLH